MSDGDQARPVLRMVAAMVVLVLVGCTGSVGERVVGRNSNGVDIEQRHRNGTVVRVTDLAFAPASTTVTIEAVNGTIRPIELNSRGSVWLLDDVGTRYKLVKPEQNGDIEIASGKAVKARLVFAGELSSRARSLRLLVNALEQEDSVDLTQQSTSSSTPSFQFDDLPIRR